jgi:hypothetical protein
MGFRVGVGGCFVAWMSLWQLMGEGKGGSLCQSSRVLPVQPNPRAIVPSPTRVLSSRLCAFLGRPPLVALGQVRQKIKANRQPEKGGAGRPIHHAAWPPFLTRVVGQKPRASLAVRSFITRVKSRVAVLAWLKGSQGSGRSGETGVDDKPDLFGGLSGWRFGDQMGAVSSGQRSA